MSQPRVEFRTRVHLDVSGSSCAGKDLGPEAAARVVCALLREGGIAEIHVTREKLEVAIFVPEDTSPPVLVTLRERYAEVARRARESTA